jgi:hypothetical protein
MNWFKKLMLKYAIDYMAKTQGGKNMIGKIMAFLDGKKQYIGAAVLVLQAVLQYLVDQDLNVLVTKLIAAWLVAANRAAVAKSTK